MARGELKLVMGKQSYKALGRMMDDPELVAMNNISTLATALSVSPATLTRLSKLLGFSGFPALQAVFRQHLVTPDRFYSSQAKQLASGSSPVGIDILTTLAEESQSNISKALLHIEPKSINTAVAWLTQGVRVHIFGYRQSAAVASFMSYGLSMIRSSVTQLGVNGHGLSVSLSQINRQDIAIFIGTSPYSRETVAAARLARRQQARVITITDSHVSPLAQWSDVNLVIPTQSHFYSNSFTAVIYIVEGLLTLTAQALGKRAINNLEARESMISELNDRF